MVIFKNSGISTIYVLAPILIKMYIHINSKNNLPETDNSLTSSQSPKNKTILEAMIIALAWLGSTPFQDKKRYEKRIKDIPIPTPPTRGMFLLLVSIL